MAPSVVHVSHYDVRGGAARSASRLHEGLRRAGADSRMLVGRREGADADVREIRRGRADALALRVQDRVGVQYAFLPSSFALPRDPWLRAASVLHLHNVHGGFFAHTALPLLARRKLLVWTLHDMWAFTGHCGYAYDSERWLVGCGRCPHLNTYPRVRRDATRLNWRVKQAVYSRLAPTIVTPSEWLAGLARQSPLLARFDVRVIPYGVDTDVFAPADRAAARVELGLPLETPLVLVVGLEPRKGGRLLPALLAAARTEAGPFDVVALGDEVVDLELPDGVAFRRLGALADERRVGLAYAAADAFLLPSLTDNLPNTLLEALACGTAVVATDAGGIPEAVADGVTGLLRPVQAEALGRALATVLRDSDLAARLGEAGRRTAVERFGLERQAAAYLELYASRLR